MYFTGRETVNKYYDAVPAIIQANMDKFAALTGRQYHLFDYIGAPDATDVIVVMGSGALTIASTVEHLIADDRKVGLVIAACSGRSTLPPWSTPCRPPSSASPCSTAPGAGLQR